MKKIMLMDCDSTIPNLALMKISAYHKSIGDSVGWEESDPDKIYASVIFKKNRHMVDGLRFVYPNTELDLGGSGYDLDKVLPDEINEQIPDYSIYPHCDSFYGFTTRGCIRRCPFCIVPIKEGKFHRLYPTIDEAMSHIVDRRYDFSNITFLDNNILADKEWFIELCNHIAERYPKAKVDFNQGLDIRLLDDDCIDAMMLLKPRTCWKFAFDSMAYRSSVENGIHMLKDHGIDVKHKCEFYVYCDGDDQVDDAVERARILKGLNATPYSMVNIDAEQTRRLKDFKKWCRPWAFWACDFEDYQRSLRKSG